MHRLNRINSAKHLLTLFTAATTPIRPPRLSSLLKSLDFLHSAATNGETCDFLPENKCGSNDNKHSYERKVLPPELSRSVVKLTCETSAVGGVCDVYVVGTCHVSTKSCQEVQAVIDFLKPQVVFLELCSSRTAILKAQNLKIPTIGEMVDKWKKNQNLFGILCSWFLAKVASELQVFPGAEFRVAYEEATKYGGKVVLGDRHVQITLQKTWAKMPLWHKTKFLFTFLFQAVFFLSPEDLSKVLKQMDNVDTITVQRKQMDDVDMRTVQRKQMDDVDMISLLIEEMSKQFPTLTETLVHERDQYMSSTLLKVASEHNSVVAVVGKGHLPGIRKNWKQPVDLKPLLSSIP